MIVAEIERRGRTEYHKIDGLCNRGEWFGRTWLVAANIGVFCYKFIIEADHEQDVLDAFTDSTHGNMIKVDEPCPHWKEEDWDNCYCEFAGNCSDRINTEYFYIYGRCKVHYFENPDDWEGITAWGGTLERVS